jgi:phosphoenolpyruvate synthase/pyruvate phosphate dikinase
VHGIDDVLHKMKEVFASLYNDRAISYRVHKGFAHADVALSAGVQRMVRSDLGASGVMFTIDTESGFDQVVFITSSYGLGETVVQGAVNPDEFYVHKPMLKAGKQAVIRRNLGSKLIQMVFASAEEKAATGKLVKTTDVPTELRNRYSLTDADVQQLAHYALVIEQHYGRPMDVEWGKDGTDGQLYILQARPETVKSQSQGQAEQRYKLKGHGTVLAEGSNLDRERHFYYWAGQFLVGGPALVAEFVHGHALVTRDIAYVDGGLGMTCVAGLLNVLAMIDVYSHAERGGAPADSAAPKVAPATPSGTPQPGALA